MLHAVTMAMTVVRAFAFLLVPIHLAHASLHDDASFWNDHPDRVKVLPGYIAGAPPVTILSGYLDYEFEGEQIHTHYMLFKAEEAFFDDEEPPLIYWSST